MQLTSGILITSYLLIGSRVSKDSLYFVARLLTKSQQKNTKHMVQTSNLVERSLFVPRNTEIADALLLVKEKHTNIEREVSLLVES